VNEAPVDSAKGPVAPPSSPVRGALALLVGGAALGLAWLARDVLLLGFFGVVLAALLALPVGFLARRMRRPVALLIVMVVLGGAFAGIGAVAAPVLADQLTEAEKDAPVAVARLRAAVERFEVKTGTGDGETKMPDVTSQALPALAYLGEGVTSWVLVGVLALFLVADPETYRKGVRGLIPREREAVFDEAWQRVGTGLRGWVRGILVSMALMGGLAGLGLWAVGIPDAALLGLITFFATFVPYLGALLSAIPGLLLGMSVDTTHFFLALGVYTGVHVIEGYVVQPLVMRKAVHVKPAILLVAQAAATAVFGVMGTIVATPLLVCLQELTAFLWTERALGKRGDAD
jgi:predicted PurR-regulated permease PerM